MTRAILEIHYDGNIHKNGLMILNRKHMHESFFSRLYKWFVTSDPDSINEMNYSVVFKEANGYVIVYFKKSNRRLALVKKSRIFERRKYIYVVLQVNKEFFVDIYDKYGQWKSCEYIPCEFSRHRERDNIRILLDIFSGDLQTVSLMKKRNKVKLLKISPGGIFADLLIRCC